jgi:hypothetical protein
MTLSQSKLADEIRKVTDSSHPDFVGFSESSDVAARRADAAQKWATAFDNYGKDVVNVNGDSYLAPPNKLGFQAALPFTSTTPAELAQHFGAAWTAYWTGLSFAIGAPSSINGSIECPNIGGNFIFGIILSSLITGVVAASLIAALTTIFGVASSDPAARAAELASAFHAATIGNIVVLTTGTDTTPPPGGPLPITNTCHLF